MNKGWFFGAFVLVEYGLPVLLSAGPPFEETKRRQKSSVQTPLGLGD